MELQWFRFGTVRRITVVDKGHHGFQGPKLGLKIVYATLKITLPHTYRVLIYSVVCVDLTLNL